MTMTLNGGAGHQPVAPAYTATARMLHWVTAVLVLGMISAGIAMSNMASGPAQNFIYSLHKSTGVILIPIILFRLAYRLQHPPAPLPEHIPYIQRMAAEGLHWTFYVLLIAQPIIGWIATAAYPAPVPFFWLFDLPAIVSPNRALSEQLFAVHRAIGFLLAFLVSGHIAAALFHHFVRRDEVLMRMLRG
jgi:cytochrome b561